MIREGDEEVADIGNLGLRPVRVILAKEPAHLPDVPEVYLKRLVVEYRVMEIGVAAAAHSCSVCLLRRTW